MSASCVMSRAKTSSKWARSASPAGEPVRLARQCGRRRRSRPSRPRRTARQILGGAAGVGAPQRVGVDGRCGRWWSCRPLSLSRRHLIVNLGAKVVLAPCCTCGSSGSCRPKSTAEPSCRPRVAVPGACSPGSPCIRASIHAAPSRPDSGRTCSTRAPARPCAAPRGRSAARSASDDALIAGRDRIGLRCETDLAAFDAHCAAGELEEAVALHRGPLLADLDEDWVLEARDEHAERLGAALARLAAAAVPGDAVALRPPPAGAGPARRGCRPRPDAPPVGSRRPRRRARDLRPPRRPPAHEPRAGHLGRDPRPCGNDPSRRSQ